MRNRIQLRTRTIPDARIINMKDGTTHLAHKAEHAVDMRTGEVLGFTLQPAEAAVRDGIASKR